MAKAVSRSAVADGKRSESPAQSSQFTIGKLDAGIAVLLGEESAHLLEFPSLLLPPGCQPGSIVNISCTRDERAETLRSEEFWQLQSDILTEYGQRGPATPSLRLRNVTQTSVTLEWDKLDLATAKLIGLTIWRNGQRVAAIPNPQNNTSTKLSGLDLDHEYTFHLVLKTTAGTFSSNILKVRTHKITDTSGICVCFGTVSPPAAVDDAREALESMGGRYHDKIQIDTTHFVCTSPGTGMQAIQYQRALQLSIPTVLPSWVLACHREKRMVQIAAHYLGSAQPAAASGSGGAAAASSRVPVPARKDVPVKSEVKGSIASRQSDSTAAPSSAPTTSSIAAEEPMSPASAASGSVGAPMPLSSNGGGAATSRSEEIDDPTIESAKEVSEALPEINEQNIDQIQSSADLDGPGGDRDTPESDERKPGQDLHQSEPALMSPTLDGPPVDIGHLEDVALDDSFSTK